MARTTRKDPAEVEARMRRELLPLLRDSQVVFFVEDMEQYKQPDKVIIALSGRKTPPTYLYLDKDDFYSLSPKDMVDLLLAEVQNQRKRLARSTEKRVTRQVSGRRV